MFSDRLYLHSQEFETMSIDFVLKLILTWNWCYLKMLYFELVLWWALSACLWKTSIFRCITKSSVKRSVVNRYIGLIISMRIAQPLFQNYVWNLTKSAIVQEGSYTDLSSFKTCFLRSNHEKVNRPCVLHDKNVFQKRKNCFSGSS